MDKLKRRMDVKEITYTVKSELGMHARPAGMFARLTKQCHSIIEISKGEKKASANRILAVMGMGIKTGDTITITAEGEDEQEVSRQIRQICEENL